jgi:hypothetical protein
MVDIGLSLLLVEDTSSTKRRMPTELIRISMVNIGVFLLIVGDTSSPERKMLKGLIRISVGNTILLRFVFDSTGILVAE